MTITLLQEDHVIVNVKRNLVASTILTLKEIGTVFYLKIVQALMRHWLNSNQVKLDVLYINKTIKIKILDSIFGSTLFVKTPLIP